MKSLVKYLKNYKKECIIAPSFKMLEALFELFVPLVITKIIDEGIKAKNTEVVVQSGILLFALALIGLSCAVTAQYFAAKAAIGFATSIREALFSKILSLSYENLDDQGSSTLITRITSDINQVQNGVNMVLRLLLRSPFIVFGAMIMAFTINVKAAIIFVVVIPVLFIIVFAITLITIPLYKKIQKALDSLTGHIRENLSGVRVVRAFLRSDSERKEFDTETDSMYSLSVLTMRISAVLNPSTLIIVNLALLFLLAKGSNLVFEGFLTNGQVYALVNYMSQILVELVKLSNLVITINKSLVSASRITDTLSIENPQKDEGSITATSISGSPLVSLKDVSFTYPKAKEPSLSHISFAINSGETIGIIGGTGSGKSTLANLLMRFYDVTDGEILYKGTNINSLTMESLRNVFSIVPQKALLFTGTLKENLLLANPKATVSDMEKAVELSASTDVINKKGEGLEFRIEEGGANLSGGQKQRLSIARTLVRNTEIVILDDSSSALDYKTDATLRSNLRSMDNTVIIIAQRVTSIKDCDKILVLDKGSLCAIGTHKELLNTSDIYKEIVASQSREEEEV